MFSPIRLALTLTFACSLNGADSQTQSIVLRPRFVPGHTRYVDVTEEIKQSVSGGSVGVSGAELTIVRCSGVFEKVESVSPDGLVKLVLTFDRQSMTVEGPVRADYDSDAAPARPSAVLLEPVFSPFIGESMNLEVDKDGHVTSFSGMTAIIEKVKKSAQGNPFFESIKTELDDEVQKVEWGDSRLALYAYKSVKPGDTWTREIRQSHRPARIVEYRVKFAELGREAGRAIARLTYTATIRAPEGAKPEPLPQGRTAEFLSGKLEGEAIFDIESGEIVRQREAGEENTALNTPTPGGKPMSLKVVAKTKTTSIIMTPDQRAKQRAENRQAAATRSATRPAPKSD